MSVKGTAQLVRRLQQLPMDTRDSIGQALAVSVVEMDAHAKQKIQGGGRSGRIYRRGSITHQASAPGEFPKTDRGELVGSLFFQVAGDKLSAMFGTALLKGRWLEYGTSRMAARPWLRPTFRALERQARDRVRLAVQAALMKAASRG